MRDNVPKKFLLTLCVLVCAVVFPISIPEEDAGQLKVGSPSVVEARVKRTPYVRSEHDYHIPNFTLLNQEGEKIALNSLFESDRPVMVNFMFVTCTTICPILTAVFAQAQRKLGPEVEEVAMVSFTIDPDFDTPEKLKGYAELYDAGPQWQFLTGTRDQIHKIQKAFDAYSQNKMSHLPLTFLRASGDSPWIRIDGITSAAALLKEYQKLIEK